MTVISFNAGEAFPARERVARFVTGLAISNDWLRSLGLTTTEIYTHVSIVRSAGWSRTLTSFVRCRAP
jgi:hypothetical protein